MVLAYLCRWKKKEGLQIDEAVENSKQSSAATTIKNTGRPSGTTSDAINDDLKRKELAKDRMAILYAQEKKNKGRVRDGHFQQIHNSVVKELGISDPKFKVSIKTIQSRVLRQSYKVESANNPLPVKEIEPVLLQICIWKQEAGHQSPPQKVFNLPIHS